MFVSSMFRRQLIDTDKLTHFWIQPLIQRWWNGNDANGTTLYLDFLTAMNYQKNTIVYFWISPVPCGNSVHIVKQMSTSGVCIVFFQGEAQIVLWHEVKTVARVDVDKTA